MSILPPLAMPGGRPYDAASLDDDIDTHAYDFRQCEIVRGAAFFS
jgi:hypothetical protein